MNTSVHFADYDTTVTPHIFFNEVRSPSVLGYAKKVTIGLPGEIVKLFKGQEQGDEIVVTKVERDSVLHLSREQMQTVKTMRQRLTVNVDQETGVITLNSEFPDPQAAAEVGQAGISLLKEYMRDYR